VPLLNSQRKEMNVCLDLDLANREHAARPNKLSGMLDDVRP